MIDFDKKCIESVQFRENGDLIELNMTKNRENAENYPANRLKMEKLRERNYTYKVIHPAIIELYCIVTIAKKIVLLKF